MTIDFIPLANYSAVFYNSIMVLTLITFLHTQVLDIKDLRNIQFIKFAGGTLLISIILYMGLRPISGRYFIDMGTYNHIFQDYAQGNSVRGNKDILFHQFTWFSAQIMTAEAYFLLCTVIYIVPLYLVSKKWFKDYWFYGFLLFVGSFSFWAYGVNGIRNGMAGSLFLLGISRDKRLFQVLWLLLAINIHKTMLLPVLGFIIVQFHNNPRSFYVFWLLSIPLSLALGGVWEGIFANLVEDDRAGYFNAEVEEGKFASTGFRWDFLVYSSIGVVSGWYYIFKQKIKDEHYIQLYNIYLFANAFWILVIRANFSNRFAYLSWFMMAVIVVYPWAKYRFLDDQHRKFGFVMLGYVSFTFLMYFVYYAK